MPDFHYVTKPKVELDALKKQEIRTVKRTVMR